MCESETSEAHCRILCHINLYGANVLCSAPTFDVIYHERDEVTIFATTDSTTPLSVPDKEAKYKV